MGANDCMIGAGNNGAAGAAGAGAGRVPLTEESPWDAIRAADTKSKKQKREKGQYGRLEKSSGIVISFSTFYNTESSIYGILKLLTAFLVN